MLLVTSKGVALGYATADGNFRPGYQYAAYISFRVKARSLRTDAQALADAAHHTCRCVPG